MKHGGKILAAGLTGIAGLLIWADAKFDNDPENQVSIRIENCLTSKGVDIAAFELHDIRGNVDGGPTLYQEGEAGDKRIFVYQANSGKILFHTLGEPNREVTEPTPQQRETMKALQTCMAPASPLPQ